MKFDKYSPGFVNGPAFTTKTTPLQISCSSRAYSSSSSSVGVGGGDCTDEKRWLRVVI